MKKDARIIEILDWLKEWLGDSFIVRDVAEVDLCAIGVASPKDSRQLVYISTYKTPIGVYNIDLETAPSPDSGQPFHTIGKFKGVNRDELFRLTVQHLGIAMKSPTPFGAGEWYPTARMRNQVRDKPKKKLNTAQKRALKAADLQLFTQKYGRKAQRGKEPNDRKYSHDVKEKTRRMKPNELDKLLRNDEDGKKIIKAKNKDSFACPVCGFPDLQEPAYDAYGCSSFDICSCCGTQFGYQDARRTHAQLRTEWIEKGCIWNSKVTAPPPGWNGIAQLRKAGIKLS